MNPRVTHVAPKASQTLLVTFSNGEKRLLDTRPYLDYGVFARLSDSAFFALVQADHGTVVWPDGIDLDPDTVYLDSVAVGQAEHA